MEERNRFLVLHGFVHFNSREVTMRHGLITRGRTALATFICVAAYASAAVAQTNYYWEGGAGTWDATSSVWASPQQNSTPAGPWVNGTSSIANIGYLNLNGNGSP